MAAIKNVCPYCSKPAVEKSSYRMDDNRTVELTCGHTIIVPYVKVVDKYEFESEDGKRPFPFQIDTIKHFENSPYGRILIAHEMGLGKTVCAAGILKLHPELMPAVIVVKASLLNQWFLEMDRWTGELAQVISTGNQKPIKKAKLFIVSYDNLAKIDFSEVPVKTVILDECQQIKNTIAKRTQAVRALVSGKVLKKRVLSDKLNQRSEIEVMANDLMKYHGVAKHFKVNFESLGQQKLGMCEVKHKEDGIIEGRITIDINHAIHDKLDNVLETILHEIAHALTPSAGHTQTWSEVCKGIGGDGKAKDYCQGSVQYKSEFEVPKHIIALSGTPIKNNAAEYFPVLNLLDPYNFYSNDGFIRNWCNVYSDNGYSSKIGGLKRGVEKEFDRITSPYIIRKTREEVAPDLPKIFRTFKYCDMEGDIAKAYDSKLDDLDDAMSASDRFSPTKWTNILAYMTAMRQLAGYAKVEPCVDFISDFLEESDRKITIFVQHHQVHELLERKLLKLDENILSYKADLNSDQKAAVLRRFEVDPKCRVMIASTQSGGEGLNLQFCHDMIMLERQWNPANEEQAEGRFSRHGSTADKINAKYFVVLGTIDEFFAELVEQKRANFKQVMDKVDVKWNEGSLMKELAEKLASSGKAKWSLRG